MNYYIDFLWAIQGNCSFIRLVIDIMRLDRLTLMKYFLINFADVIKKINNYLINNNLLNIN